MGTFPNAYSQQTACFSHLKSPLSPLYKGEDSCWFSPFVKGSKGDLAS